MATQINYSELQEMNTVIHGSHELLRSIDVGIVTFEVRMYDTNGEVLGSYDPVNEILTPGDD